MLDALDRWAATPRRWRLGELVAGSVYADSDRLAVALDALIEIAVNYTSPEDSIELAVREDAGMAAISVRDSRTGISASDLNRVFDRFAGADPGRSRRTGGFGLGLSIVRAIVEAHGGSVRVESTEGEGSVFEILLSVTGGTSPLLPAGRAAQREPATTREIHRRG